MNQEIMVIEEKQQIDYFDQLPDAILLIILNKIYDARSLCCCIAVSKRFAVLVPEVGSVSITRKVKKPSEDGSKSRNGSKSFFKNFVSKFLTKPFNFMQQIILLNNRKLLNSSSTNKFGNGVDIVNWVSEVLKNFHDVESINLELPCHGGEIGNNKNLPLLKWEAGFGKGMEGCVILGATSIQNRNKRTGKCGNSNTSESDEATLFSDEELKWRIIWIISCLIASSGRHNLMKKILTQCPKLSNAVISDAGKQGKLYMNAAQIQELRGSISIESTTRINTTDTNDSSLDGNQEAEAGTGTTSQMGYVGNLVMKLWYVKELELPSNGQIMKGATLVVIKPENKVNAGGEKGKECDGVSMWGGFEGDQVFEEASKELLKRKERRVYRLEVNSF